MTNRDFEPFLMFIKNFPKASMMHSKQKVMDLELLIIIILYRWGLTLFLLGRILFEVGGVPLDIAKEALRLAAQKLPVKTKFIIARDYEA